jgi:hypothetical protein
MSSVEFDEDRISYSRPQVSGMPNFQAPGGNVASSNAPKMTQWLMRHGIKSAGAAQAILIAVVLLNIVITIAVVTAFIL